MIASTISVEKIAGFIISPSFDFCSVRFCNIHPEHLHMVAEKNDFFKKDLQKKKSPFYKELFPNDHYYLNFTAVP